MKALYRLYRPTKLSDVVGQDSVVKPLSEAIKKQKISHAYLFTGPRGCGKTSVARIFAHEINNFPYELEDSYVDIIEIDAASNTGVDNIRELRERTTIAPTLGKYKVYIIDEVHMLSKAAFNALLKTLEEPPEHVVFIMATTDAYKVPVTITSRTQIYTFQLAAPATMSAHLQKIAAAEHIDIDNDALDMIVRRGGGSFRDSISLLDQISTMASGKITAEYITSVLGLPKNQAIDQLLDAYELGDIATVSDCIKNFFNTGVRPETIVSEILSRIIENPSPSRLPLLKTLPSVQAPFAEAKLLLCFLGSQTSPLSSVPSMPLRQAPPMVTSIPSSPATTTPATPTTTAESSTGTSAAASVSANSSTQPNSAKATTAAVSTTTTAETTVTAETTATVATATVATITETATVNTPTPANGAFDWESFLLSVQTSSNSLYDILQKSNHQLDGATINIIPEKKIYKSILKSPNNAKVLVRHLPVNYSLNICDPGESIQKDPTLSQISDIMGNIQEVNNGGSVPF